MAKIRIVTDSNSGITQAEGDKLGISVLPMPFLINGEEYFEDITLTQPQFYEHLKGDSSVSTSQPSVTAVTELWDNLLAQGYEEIIHIPMSSGLSESCHTAENLAKEYGGKVHVVDNKRISLTQKQSVYDALTLINKGYTTTQIKETLLKTSLDASIYISLDTLKYLKKGGRLTPAAALVGTIFRIKPVLQIQGDKLDAFKKVQTLRRAKDVMINAIRSDVETRFADLVAAGELQISVAHTQNDEEAECFFNDLKHEFPNIPICFKDPLSLSVSCHIGPGALACAAVRVIK